MPGLVADATRIWELNLYWPLHAQCCVWDPKGKGVDVWECIRPHHSTTGTQVCSRIEPFAPRPAPPSRVPGPYPPPFVLSPQTTSTGDTLRVDEVRLPPRVGVFASAIRLCRGAPKARQKPYLSSSFFASVHRRSTPFLTHSGAGCSSIRALPHPHRAPPPPLASQIAPYPTRRALHMRASGL
ncbi:hypothetical protein LXA43DRAFT_1024014, partial [Ganoderma leucocontextum]